MNEKRKRPKGQLFALVASAVIALLLGYFLGNYFEYGSPDKPPKLDSATLLPQAADLPDFELMDQNGQVFNNQNLQGKWHFLFFGYTHCPDVCPTTLLRLTEVYNRTAAEHDLQANTDVIFVSVDPGRDTPQHLKKYVEYFAKYFIGLTGKKEQIDKLSKALGIAYSIHPPEAEDEPDNYLVDHSAAILLINPQGQFQAVFLGEQDPQKIADDFIKIAKFVE
ncbi:MAG: SCO family protein [gamma proteobacterium symbiont of Bathyaustriella thionipta]|nr:SCO family protein [gamma proteobacterium symbiont of Bathyaustriella thionipta]